MLFDNLFCSSLWLWFTVITWPAIWWSTKKYYESVIRQINKLHEEQLKEWY